MSKAYVTGAIRNGIAIGQGAGPTDHFFYLRHGDTEAWARDLRLKESGEEL